MEYDYKKIEEKMLSLPEDLQAAMASIETANLIQDIAEKHGLTIEQTGLLFDITGYVMLGFLPSAKFQSEITKQISIDRDTANELIRDINSEVFAQIRSSLQKIQEQEQTQPETNMPSKEHVLNTIENPTSSPISTSINLLAEEYPLVIPGQKSEPTKPATAAPNAYPPIPASRPAIQPPKNLAEYYMISKPTPAPVTPPVSPASPSQSAPAATSKGPSPILGKTRVPGMPDPYREPIE